ncbi:MAG: transposase [Nitrososphaerales archaeon]
MALLLMYLKSMNSMLELIRFLKSDPEWLAILNLKRNVDGKMQYMVPDNSTFSKFAGRLGREKIVEIFAHVVVELMKMRL